MVLDLGLASERGWQALKVLKENPSTQDVLVLFCSLEQEGSLGFRGVRVLDSPTCWGRGAKTPNKLASPAHQPREIPETQQEQGGGSVLEMEYLTKPMGTAELARVLE